jgi:periplasmic protein TonB
MNTTLAEKRPLAALGRMGAVAGVHAAVLYLIATGLGIMPPLIAEPVIDTRLIEDRQELREAPPEPPRPVIQEPRLTVEQPEPVPIDSSDSTDRVFAEIDNSPPRPPEIFPTGAQHTVVAVRQDSRFPLSQPTYPARDIREGNEGTVELEVYVMPTGRIGDARVIKSAGSPSLDQSAIDEAKRRWRMLPATRDGEPYAQWHRLKVTFNLKNR